MGYDSERQAIEEKFETGWAAATPVASQNSNYEPVPGTEYVEIRIMDGLSDQVSLGNNALFRYSGLIAIEIRVNKGEGSGNARRLADNAIAIFRSQPVFSGILCRSPYVQVVGDIEGWYQVNVMVPFQRDENF